MPMDLAFTFSVHTHKSRTYSMLRRFIYVSNIRRYKSYRHLMAFIRSMNAFWLKFASRRQKNNFTLLLLSIEWQKTNMCSAKSERDMRTVKGRHPPCNDMVIFHRVCFNFRFQNNVVVVVGIGIITIIIIIIGWREPKPKSAISLIPEAVFVSVLFIVVPPPLQGHHH